MTRHRFLLVSFVLVWAYYNEAGLEGTGQDKGPSCQLTERGATILAHHDPLQLLAQGPPGTWLSPMNEYGPEGMSGRVAYVSLTAVFPVLHEY